MDDQYLMADSSRMTSVRQKARVNDHYERCESTASRNIRYLVEGESPYQRTEEEQEDHEQADEQQAEGE